MNADLQILQEWCINTGLLLNEGKTEVINFSWRNPSDTYNNLFFLNRFAIPMSEKVKCLGFIIDRKLLWESHIDQVIRKVNFCIRSLHHCSLVLPLSVRKKLAFSLLISKILYGIEILSGTGLVILNKLRVCFNNIIRFVFKIQWNCPISMHFKDLIGCNFSQFIHLRCLILLYFIIINHNI